MIAAWPIEVTGESPYLFRSGEWATIIGVQMVAPMGSEDRPCFVVQFRDGVEDYWPMVDAAAHYKFRRRQHE